MTRWRFSALLSLLLMWGWTPILSAEVFRARESGVGANFSSIAGCIQTSVSMVAFERVEREPPSRPESSAEVHMGIFSFDECNGIFLPSRIGRASGNDVIFQIDAKLDAATVAATVTLVDDNGVSSVVTVKGSWTAVGPPVYDTFVDHTHQPGFSSITRFSGSERDAVATVTVLDGGVNITPHPGQFASLDQFREAFVTIGVFEEAKAPSR
jgi:hypothetical protein